MNLYSILVLFAGILVLLIPFYIISKWILIAQALIALQLFIVSGRLFSSTESKLKEVDILKKRNLTQFRPDTFEMFMQAPCGRLVVRAVLRDLNKQKEYRNLLRLRKPFKEVMKEGCKPDNTVIYINEEFNKELL